MKRFTICVALLVLFVSGTMLQANSSSSVARRLFFAKGAHSKTITGHLTKRNSEHFYKIKVRAKQHLSIKVFSPTDHEGIIPLVFVTEPDGAFSGEKSQRFDTNATKAGDYLISVVPNLMASNGDSGTFLLKVWAK